ncbi:hypothetical protein [Altererythrobacter sp. MF3-039]|uniref:hypothetical protein n=1 Tax=Altererythrobacter sp. MF3-039 TaxID=3252901 RepID=UPI00390CB5F4
MELDPATLDTMLAEGEAQLEELRRGVPAGRSDPRIDALEDRLDQQESVIRHTLTMLIEWIESQDRDAANPN